MIPDHLGTHVESASVRSSIASLPALFIFLLNIPLPFSVDTFLASIIQYPLTLLIFHSYLLFCFDCAGSSFLRELFSSYGCRLLIMVASLAAGLQAHETQWLQLLGSPHIPSYSCFFQP